MTDWTVMRDTREGAFSVEVPAGWQVTGGCYRLGVNNPRFLVDMTSPDGLSNLRIGDSAVPAFTVPGPGWAEGMRTSTGADWAVTARYLPGRDFAVAYGAGRFEGSLSLKRSGELPPVTSPAREVLARTAAGNVVNTTAGGEALFRCVAGGRELAAYVAAETTLTASHFSPVKNWAVTALVSFTAPRESASAALRLLLRSGRSFQLSPDWVRRQAAASAASTQAILAQGRQAAAQQQQMLLVQARQAAVARQERFERLDAQRSRQFMEMDDIINGVQWTTDTVTGQQREVWAGPNPNYFYNPAAGVTVNSTFSPGDPFSWHHLTPTAR